MSIKVMSEVWEHAPFVGTDLLVLLALADMANDDRECWPSIKTIAHKGRITTKQAANVIKNLELQGIIEIEHRKLADGGNTSNLYHIKGVAQWDLLVVNEKENLPPHSPPPPPARGSTPPLHSSPPHSKAKRKKGKESVLEPKKETKKAPTRSHPLFPMKFPSNVRAYTSDHIAAYNKEYLADMKALVLAWHGDMYSNGLTNIGIEDCRDYIEVHKEALRLNIPCNDYPALAKYTQKKEHWLIEKGSRIPIKFMLKHVTDYKPAPAKVYDDPAMDLNIPQATTPILLQRKEEVKS